MRTRSAFWIFVVMVAIVFTGCSEEKTINKAKTVPATSVVSSVQAETGYTYTLNDVSISMNAEMAPIVTALGEPDNYFEAQSCAFQGLDKVYTYGSVVITTYPVNDVDYVSSIELKDDTVQTTEGICIGAAKSDVTGIYGSPSRETDTSYIYAKSDSELSFIFDDDCVQHIIYSAITQE